MGAVPTNWAQAVGRRIAASARKQAREQRGLGSVDGRRSSTGAMEPGRTACCEWTSWQKDSLEQRRHWTKMPRITRKLASGVVRDRQTRARDEMKGSTACFCAALLRFLLQNVFLNRCQSAAMPGRYAYRDPRRADSKPKASLHSQPAAAHEDPVFGCGYEISAPAWHCRAPYPAWLGGGLLPHAQKPARCVDAPASARRSSRHRTAAVTGDGGRLVQCDDQGLSTGSGAPCRSALHCTVYTTLSDWRVGPLCSPPERAACLSAGRPSQIMCNSRSCFYWASARPSTSAPSSATPRLQSGKCTAAGLVADPQCRDAGTPSCTRTYRRRSALLATGIGFE
ncbi:hypothetical protein BKA63DRAFT_490796 [Paraphoma chrysanthemicola]|nr:hypothetical protein BKA63DRAFT_490796 [Paraphoma chrysanthemicola]